MNRELQNGRQRARSRLGDPVHTSIHNLNQSRPVSGAAPFGSGAAPLGQTRAGKAIKCSIANAATHLDNRELQIKETQGTTEDFTVFLDSSLAERLSAIESATKNKNLPWQTAIKNGLLNYLQNIDTTKVPLEKLKDLEYVARLLLTRGASNKFLLEQLALTLEV